MNITALKEVQAAIMKDPERFFMHGWFSFHEGEICGCVAGTAIINAHPEWKGMTQEQWRAMLAKEPLTVFPGLNEFRLGMELLGLTQMQGQKLFCMDEWPAQFRNACSLNEFTEEFGLNAVNRIQHFIDTNGTDKSDG